LIENPVIRKELFLRLRLRQVPSTQRWVGGVSLGLLIGWIYFSVFRWILSDNSTHSGSDTWMLCMVGQICLTCLLGPAVAANSITQEKEQQTWDMLIFTRLKPTEIIFGKLVARLSLLLMMYLAIAPIELVCWIKSPSEITATKVALSSAFLLISALLFTTIGLYMSWLLNRTLFAIMSSYSIVVGGLLILTSIVTLMLSSLINSDEPNKNPIMWVNPAMMAWEAMNPRDSAYNVAFLIFGLIVYLALTAMMLWHMAVGFRRFALMA
jgi:ABC-2 type transport system permease protein